MELFFIATGVYHKLKTFETYMQSIPWVLPFKDKEGKDHKQAVYGMLEPIQLYRYIFPKEELDSVLKTLDLPSDSYNEFNTQSKILRKILKLKPIPKPDDKAIKRLLNKEHVAIKAIGIKEDKMVNHDGMVHEGL